MCAGAVVVAAVTVSVATLASAAVGGFSDVPATHSSHAAISDLASRGIINGYADGRFGPGDPVTRQQFAKMIVLTGGYPVSETDVCAFVDVTKGDGSTFFPDNFIAVCAARGISTGVSPTTFNPAGRITRYQVTSMVVRMADDLQPGLLSAPPVGWVGNVMWVADATHGANAARAEYNGLLAGLDLLKLGPGGHMPRGEVAQVLHNLLGKLAPGSTTSTLATTPTTKQPDTWTNLRPTGGVPSGRGDQSMVYDSTDRKVILFGGVHVGDETTTLLDDTWAYDSATNTWADLRPSGAPPARTYLSMAYDAEAGQVLLFGGQDWTSVFRDTWAYDPGANTWTELHPAGGPPSCMYAATVYDPAAGRVVLFGGQSDSGWMSVGQSDTWAYDTAMNSWAELHPSGLLPPARRFHSMVYDPVNVQVIMFGGQGAAGLLNDTWAYDSATNRWTKLSPVGDHPPARRFHSMVYDSANARVILLGGQGSMAAPDQAPLHLTDMWAFDPTAGTWTQLGFSGGSPPARASYPVVYDSATGKMILFGGYGFDGVSFNDTWAYGQRP